MYYTLLLLLFITLYKNSIALQKDGDKIIMQPVELIDLVIQEQMRSDRPAIRRRYKENAKTAMDALGKIEVQTGNDHWRPQTERLKRDCKFLSNAILANLAYILKREGTQGGKLTNTLPTPIPQSYKDHSCSLRCSVFQNIADNNLHWVSVGWLSWI